MVSKKNMTELWLNLHLKNKGGQTVMQALNARKLSQKKVWNIMQVMHKFQTVT